MKARLVLMEEPEPGAPIWCELDGAETPSGEKLEIAALAPAGTQTVAHHQDRTKPDGYPVIVYTTQATP